MAEEDPKTVRSRLPEIKKILAEVHRIIWANRSEEVKKISNIGHKSNNLFLPDHGLVCVYLEHDNDIFINNILKLLRTQMPNITITNITKDTSFTFDIEGRVSMDDVPNFVTWSRYILVVISPYLSFGPEPLILKNHSH